MKFLSVCSGIEAASQAWNPLGWKAVAFSEIEPFPCSVLAHHYPDTPNWGDMTKYLEWPDVPNLDVLCGGTPCQSFSVAGLRAGLADPRGNLALTYLAIAARYRPRWLVWENVPGVFSSLSHDAPDPSPPPPPVDLELDGQELETYDEYTAEELHAFNCFLAGLSELGYGWAYRVLDAQFFGVPQRRRRPFVVGCLGGWPRAAAVLFERHSLSGNPAPRRETRKDAAAGAGDGTAFSVRPVSHGAAWRGDGADNFATTAHYPEEWGPSDDRRLTCSCGHPDPSHMQVQAFGGNDTRGPIEVATARNACASASGRMDFESETFLVAHSLRGEGFDASEDGTGRGTPLVPVAPSYVPDVAATMVARSSRGGGQTNSPGHQADQELIAFSAKDHDADAQVELSPTLRAGGHSSSHANAGVMPAIAYEPHAFDARQADVLQYGPITGPMDTGIPGPSAMIGMQVRRLTPEECEALQGFKRGYTNVPHRGKPAADGPRYKALGNSWAVPCAKWIGERIAMVEGIK